MNDTIESFQKFFNLTDAEFINLMFSIIGLIFLSMMIYVIVKMIKSVKWWKRSSKYVKEKMKTGDVIYASINSGPAKVVTINENTVDIIITVDKSRIYTIEEV